MIRAYFLKPETKEPRIELLAGLARCIKDVPLEYISDHKTQVKAERVFPERSKRTLC